MGIHDIPLNAIAYETASWYYEDRKFKYIKVEQASQTEKQFRMLVQNLITDAASTVLKTRYPNDYKMNEKLFYRDKYWIIRNVAENALDISPQALGLVKPHFEYILEIQEADKSEVYNASPERDF